MQRWSNNYEISFGRITPAVRMLLIVTIGCWVVQTLLESAGNPVTQMFGLSLAQLKRGFLWQLVTYMFLHGSWWHLFLNMLLLFMLGPETERGMGRGQFLILYFVSGVLGGFGWLIISAVDTPFVPCVGASGAIFGIIGAFAALYPHRQITLLLFFVIPITMKAWVMGVMMASIELIFLWTHPLGGGVANAAHLAGGVAGYVYARTVFRSGSESWAAQPPAIPKLFRREANSAKDEAEVDRILDKIEQQGMHSLTRAERDRLHKRSRQLRK